MSKLIVRSEAESRSVDYLHDRIRGETPPNSNVLDLGVGQAKYLPELAKRVSLLTVIEGFEPYLGYVKLHAPHANVIQEDIYTALKAIEGRRFDVAMAIDVMEHLDIYRALECLEIMMTIARRIVLFVPEGFHPQENSADGFSNDLQRHRSMWSVDYLTRLGFEVERWERFHAWRADLVETNALWAVWRRLP